EVARGFAPGGGAAQIAPPAEVVIGLRLRADDGGEMENDICPRGYRRLGQRHDVAGEPCDRERRVERRRLMQVEQRQTGDGPGADCSALGQSRGDLAAEETAAAQNADVHPAAPSFESLSGHIPRSWLRSSDLLPFYHQYPAACCGDFLFPRLGFPLLAGAGKRLTAERPDPIRQGGSIRSKD